MDLPHAVSVSESRRREVPAVNSARPMVAVELWALCFEHLRNDTGEVLLSREQMAEEVGVAPKRVSEVMSELVKIGAISRVRERVPGMRGSGVVRYFMNPNVATQLSGKARDDAQRSAPMLALVGGSSGECVVVTTLALSLCCEVAHVDEVLLGRPLEF